MVVRREVRYNKHTDTAEQVVWRYKYMVAVVNQPREISRIRQRFIDQMVPVGDLRDIYDLQIPGTKGIHCAIFSFSSNKGIIENPEKIYDSDNFIKDRSLVERDDHDFDRWARTLVSIS